MKDEELAEERATKFTEINYNEPDNYGTEKEIGYHAYYCGFLAGLKAGRPQLHDLEKDPNDLPKDDMSEVAIITPLGKWEKGIFRRVDCKCYWRIIGFNENVKVIAWYEMPTFDKE